MILQLLLALAAPHVVQAKFQNCPDDSACLYFARCVDNSKAANYFTLATENAGDYDQWFKDSCKTSAPSMTELFVRPLSNHKWSLTLQNSAKNPVITFGDSLTINEDDASFKVGSDDATKFTSTVDANNVVQLLFTIDYTKKKLLEELGDSKFTYSDKAMNDSSTSYVLPLFWKKIRELTPCDASLIINDCAADAKDCTAPNIKDDSVECKTGENLWRKSENSKWQKLTSISCEKATKEWKTEAVESIKGRGTRQAKEEHSGKMELRCAVKEPEDWTEVTTELPTDPSKDSTAAPKEPTKDENHANSILHVLMVPIFVYIAFM